jgi:hypothetical protein
VRVRTVSRSLKSSLLRSKSSCSSPIGEELLRLALQLNVATVGCTTKVKQHFYDLLIDGDPLVAPSVWLLGEDALVSDVFRYENIMTEFFFKAVALCSEGMLDVRLKYRMLVRNQICTIANEEMQQFDYFQSGRRFKEEFETKRDISKENNDIRKR